MNKFLFFFFVVVYCLYLPFSRRPDYFDGLKTPATIHYKLDSSSKKMQPFAEFSLDGKTRYSVQADYLFRHLKEGEQRTVIYENAKPEEGKIYSFWGYWLTWSELLACLVGYFVLFQAAKSIVNAPSPDSIKELEEYEKRPKVKKRKYK